MSDTDRVRAGEQAGFEAFVATSQASLLRFAHAVGGGFDAEDLVQEALIKAASRWTAVGQGSPLGFCRTVIYRDAVSRWRRVRVGRKIGTRPLPRPSDDPAEVVPLEMLMQTLIGALPRQQAAVVVLRYLDDLSINETAAVLDLTAGSVKRHAFLGLRSLRNAYDSQDRTTALEGD